jgi:hypothetical protein
VAKQTGSNKNVELNGRDTFKLFRHGITHMIIKSRRIDGGWHISMARHLQLFFGTTNMISRATKVKFARVYGLLFIVHSILRMPVLRVNLTQYQTYINDLLESMVEINMPSTKSKCNSIKYHWPRHWSDTRRELGCSAAEKSLERKLGEIQKRNFSFTNSRYGVDVSSPLAHMMNAKNTNPVTITHNPRYPSMHVVTNGTKIYKKVAIARRLTFNWRKNDINI